MPMRRFCYAFHIAEPLRNPWESHDKTILALQDFTLRQEIYEKERMPDFFGHPLFIQDREKTLQIRRFPCFRIINTYFQRIHFQFRQGEKSSSGVF